MACDIAQLAADGKQFNTLNLVQFQAAKVFLLAEILKAAGGTDYTDVHALAQSMLPYTMMPGYSQRSAYLQVLTNEAVALDVPDLTVPFKEAMAAAGCDRPDELFKAEIFLLCQLLEAQRA